MYFNNPFEQFELFNISFFNFFNFNNLFVYYYLIFLSFFIFFILGVYRILLLPSVNQMIIEDIYRFVLVIFQQQIGIRHSLVMFPLVITLFIFILISNLSGLLPYGFTVTGHILLTFTLSFSIFIAITINGFINHKIYFLKLFVPSNTPKVLLVLLVGIEIISYFIRPFSLSIRLFANMLAGHILLNIVTSFTLYLLKLNFIFSLIPFLFIFAIGGLELAIAFIQSYVFIVLTIIYINDSYNISH